MCPKPFSRAKNKRKLFSDGKSRGPLLAGVALKFNQQKRHIFVLKGITLNLKASFLLFGIDLSSSRSSLPWLQ